MTTRKSRDEWHTLTDIGKDARTATCQQCGPGAAIRVLSTKGYTTCRNGLRENDAKHNAAHISRHRISRADMAAMIDAQGGGCAVCGSAERRLVVDLDHACCPGDRTCGKCIRGVLCSTCNTALGMLHDDADKAERAAEYLRNR